MKSVLSFFFGICFITALAIMSVRTVAFQKDFYISFYEKENLAEELDVDEEVLNESILSLLGYIQQDRSDISDVFNEKEKEHMKDVKGLYVHAKYVQVACLVFVLGVIFVFYKWERRHMFSYLSRGFVQASFTFLICAGLLAMWAWMDFSDFWYRIHTLFFTNDLWILDPRESFMILICPENLFSSLCIRVSIGFLIGVAALNLWSLWYLLKKSVIGFDKF